MSKVMFMYVNFTKTTHQIRGGKNPSRNAAYRVKQEEAVVSRKNLIEMKSRLAEFSIV